jgi:DNA (cytosine-5)-methyltransferase 1
MKLRVVDLFCGAGGLSEGFRQAGFDLLAGSDVDPDACATFQLNFPEALTVAGDIRKNNIRAALLEACAGADVIVGGPPCQAFSQVRNHVRVIEDPRNSLYREFVRVVGRVLPVAFVMENVPGLDQMGVREQIEDDLQLHGEYNVRSQLADAADHGVPQTRKRLLFVGIRKSMGLEPPLLQGSGAARLLTLARHNGKHPTRYDLEANRSAERLLAKLLDDEDSVAVTARQAIGDLTHLAPGRRDDDIRIRDLPEAMSAYQRASRNGAGEALMNVSVPRINKDTILRLRGIPSGGNYRDLSPTLRRRYLSEERWGPNNGSGSLGRRHFYAYRRLHPDIWSWTLNTKADSVYHFAAERALSVREFARLQSFPDRFTFVTDSRVGSLPGRIEGGAAHSRYRQVGNAVPPLLARAMARQLAQRLASVTTGTLAV